MTDLNFAKCNVHIAQTDDILLLKSSALSALKILRIKPWMHIDESECNKIGIRQHHGALTNTLFFLCCKGLDLYSNAEMTNDPDYHGIVCMRLFGRHLNDIIDRNYELEILSRLKTVNTEVDIIGLFENGRFERYLESASLTIAEFKMPLYYRQIAKWLRKIHDSVKILPTEKQMDPSAWKLWNKFKDNCYQYMKLKLPEDCGLDRPDLTVGDMDRFFREVAVYREALQVRAQKSKELLFGEEVVICHNDPQYGNILKLHDPDETKKNGFNMLKVIDFEYAGPNPRAFDVASVFGEWMSNYEDITHNYITQTENYPSDEIRMDFIRHYLFDDDDENDGIEMDKKCREFLTSVDIWGASVSANWVIWAIMKDKWISEATHTRPEAKNYTSKSEGNLALEEPEVFDHISFAAGRISAFLHEYKTYAAPILAPYMNEPLMGTDKIQIR